MIKKFGISAIVMSFILLSTAAFASELVQPNTKANESTKDRISRGVNNIFYGPVETPDNLSDTKTKGSEVAGYNKRTRSGLERGIARVCTGVWQLATFWNSDPGCVTSASAAKSASSGVTK